MNIARFRETVYTNILQVIAHDYIDITQEVDRCANVSVPVALLVETHLQVKTSADIDG